MCDRIFMIFRGRKVLDGTLHDIQEQYGADTVRVRTAGGVAALAGMPEVEAVNDFGQMQEVRLKGDSAGVPAAAGGADGGVPLRSHAPVAPGHLRPDRQAAAGRAGARGHGGVMNKILIVAQSEFGTLVRSKAFIIGSS